MKKLVVFLLVAFVCYKLYQKAAEQNREKLIGTWSMEHNFQGGSLRVSLNLKPEGTATIDANAIVQGHTKSNSASGLWRCTGSKVLITFNRSDVPVYQLGQDYGGHILTLDDKTLTYQSDKGPETWTR